MVFADACAANRFSDEPESSVAYGLDSTEGWGRLRTRLGVGGAYMHFRHVLWGFPRIFTVFLCLPMERNDQHNENHASSMLLDS